MSGLVSDIKRMSVHDGPGIRTTMFLMGCPLRCLWCHNPENLEMKKVLSFTPKLCVGCGACLNACGNGAHIMAAGTHKVDFSRCVSCGDCVRECYTGALRLFGTVMEASYAAEKLLEDRKFYETSGGGVTFSGGEPLLQASFIREVMERLKREGIHTAVDTCADVPWESFTQVIPFTDLFLCDVKHIDSGRHMEMTGRGNERILENIRRLAEIGAAVEIRTPVIPGFNDDLSVLSRIGGFLSGLGNITAWRILPYHSMGKAKYESIGMPYKMPEIEAPDARYMEALKKELRKVFDRVMLSSDLS